MKRFLVGPIHDVSNKPHPYKAEIDNAHQSTSHFSADHLSPMDLRTSRECCPICASIDGWAEYTP